MAQTNLSTKQTQTPRQRADSVVAKAREGKEETDWETGVGRCKLSHLEWINNKVLTYITENTISCDKP